MKEKKKTQEFEHFLPEKADFKLQPPTYSTPPKKTLNFIALGSDKIAG